MLDYEFTGPDAFSADYDAIRPEFGETGSPRLGTGLNLGAQLYWQFRTDPGLKVHTAHVVTYPQYWGFRLTGVLASEASSLGCHTDLWNPGTGRPSALVDRLGIAELIAPLRAPDAVLGPVRAEIAEATGLPPATPVLCGIHDSNASLYPHLVSRKAPFSVVSTGTWVIAMAVGAGLRPLDPARDTLVNVNGLGQPVPSARFMGGRELDLATQGKWAEPGADDIAHLLAGGQMLLPSVVPGSGPFQGREAHWHGGEPTVGSALRSAAVALYLALMTDHCLSLIGAAGPVIVEGPFSRNPTYLRMLAAVTGRPVLAPDGATGTSQGAALLALSLWGATPAAEGDVRCVTPLSDVEGYVALWRQLIG
jgi:sugar (pentulose or hexulose) kinase